MGRKEEEEEGRNEEVRKAGELAQGREACTERDKGTRVFSRRDFQKGMFEFFSMIHDDKRGSVEKAVKMEESA